MAYVNPQSGFTTKPDYAGALSNLAQMFQQRNAMGQQNKQFGMQMQQAQQGMQQQQQRFDAEMSFRNKQSIAEGERWKETFEETQAKNKIDMERMTALIDVLNMDKEKEAQRQEVMTIMGAEKALPGVSSYDTMEKIAEHPGIVEAGLSGFALSLGAEGLSGFVKEEGADLKAATDVYNSAQMGVPFESLNVDEALRGVYDTGVTDRDRNVRKDEAAIAQIMRGNRGSGGPSKSPLGDASKQLADINDMIEEGRADKRDVSAYEVMRDQIYTSMGMPPADGTQESSPSPFGGNSILKGLIPENVLQALDSQSGGGFNSTDPGPGGGDGTGTQAGPVWDDALVKDSVLGVHRFIGEMQDKMQVITENDGSLDDIFKNIETYISETEAEFSGIGAPESVLQAVGELRD